ncbi:MAG: hypothetical protein J2P26_00580 [Nocardiopsaceae bacterium]|nr:hypothetical protein [Nocardiopsaceae bacterium]
MADADAIGSFTVPDMDRWPQGAEKSELIDGSIVFYGFFNEEDAEHARGAYPEKNVTLEPHDPANPAPGANNIVIS